MVPVEGLVDERHDRRAAAAEQDRRDRHTLGVVPLGRGGRVLRDPHGETTVRVRRGLRRFRGPVVATPVDEVRRRRRGEALPPDVAVVGERGVREDDVSGEHRDRVRVRPHARPRGDAEEPGLRVDGPQCPVGADPHPADVVADRLDLPARQARHHHREVGLAARRREPTGHVAHLTVGRGELHHEHVLSEPPFVTGDRRRDPQRQTLLAQQGVAPVARAVGPDLPGFWEVDDVGVLRVAGPGGVGLTGCKRRAHGVEARHELTVRTERLEGRGPHPRHHRHVDHDERRIGELDANLRVARADRPHREGDDIKRASPHRTGEEPDELGAHRDRFRPVVRRSGVVFVRRADERPSFDAGCVTRIRPGEVAPRPLRGVQAQHGSLFDEERAEPLVFLPGTVAPFHALGLDQVGEPFHPCAELAMAGGRRAQRSILSSGPVRPPEARSVGATRLS